MSAIRIGVVGMGKIATDEHLPAIAANPRFELAATVERSAPATAINFTSHAAMLAAADRLDAVAITTPPAPRYGIARDCIDAGLHVLLEKPPTATLAEIEELRGYAKNREVSLFTTWHAQHNQAVVEAAVVLAGRRIRDMTIVWHEDVEKWHPGQRWIWEPGGFGVFDPGINAFSIASAIFPDSLFVRSAALQFPRGSHTPIAVEIMFESPASSGTLSWSIDWRRTAGEEWTISLTTEDGTGITLLDGGARLLVDGEARPTGEKAEYPDIYRRFAELIERGEGQVDIVPLQLVADCLLVGSRHVLD
ncbi:MAG: Gfo/Idh/MocA family protein [Sphingomicrobium sp.]